MRFKLKRFKLLFRFIEGFIWFLVFGVRIEQNFREKCIMYVVKIEHGVGCLHSFPLDLGVSVFYCNEFWRKST